MCSSFKGDKKDSFIPSEKANKDCASVSSGAGGRGSTFQEEVQQHQAEPVGRISCEVEIPGDHLTFQVRCGLPCPHMRITGLCRLGLLALFNCILSLKTEEFLVGLQFFCVCDAAEAFFLSGLKHRGGGRAADITPACPVFQPLHNSHFHGLCQSDHQTFRLLMPRFWHAGIWCDGSLKPHCYLNTC